MQKQLFDSILVHPFAFESHYSIEHCVELLLAASERDGQHVKLLGGVIRWNPRNKLLVTVEQVDDRIYSFKLHKDAGRNLNVEVLGTLEQRGSHTHIYGSGQIGATTLWFSIIWLVIWVTVCLIIGRIEMAIFGFLVVLLLGLIVGRERNRLIRMLIDMLATKT